MGFLNVVVSVLFLGFIVILVVGFNRQMLQRGEERRQRYEKMRLKDGKRVDKNERM